MDENIYLFEMLLDQIFAKLAQKYLALIDDIIHFWSYVSNLFYSVLITR